ncbi:hypothetical protein N4R57_12680 [Rhodobacteraceae bacterium D3-12]|nr:hypothetical protein N4R57_12680 [Rhodobacteraceae bacterium D3-12]
MSGPGPAGRIGPVFLEKANYRRRRLVDAVRLMPVLGALLWAVPLLWTQGDTSSSSALLYVFGIWFGLVVLAGMLSRWIAGEGWAGAEDSEEEPDAKAPPREAGG